jgi:trehalose-6-phosphatase
VEHGLGELEILPKVLHKGTFVKRVLELAAASSGGAAPDMVLVVGDDVVDEKMFTAAFAYVAAQAAKPGASHA